MACFVVCATVCPRMAAARLAMMCAILAISPVLRASTIYIDITGASASGDVNGVLFSNQPFRLEYAVDTSVPDAYAGSGPAYDHAYFYNALHGGNLQIGSTTYPPDVSGSNREYRVYTRTTRR